MNKERILFELIIIREQLKAMNAKINSLFSEFSEISPEPKRETIDFGEIDIVTRSIKWKDLLYLYWVYF